MTETTTFKGTWGYGEPGAFEGRAFGIRPGEFKPTGNDSALVPGALHGGFGHLDE